MNILEQIKESIKQAALSCTTTMPLQWQCTLNETKQFGDLSTNIAMLIAKDLKQNPRLVAENVLKNLHSSFIERCEIAGPGFLNIGLKPIFYETFLRELQELGSDFFATNTNKKYAYNVEFLSANPTGPIHIGNGRGGIIGDVLANVLRFVKNKVTKEYYINDAGNQITKLGLSLKIRCMQQVGQDVEMPEDSYQGEYLILMAQELVAFHGSTIIEKDEAFFGDYAKAKILIYLKETLSMYGITYDVWFSEKSLHESGAIKQALAVLEERGYLYTQDDAIWFKSTLFGDDKDRVLVRANGEPTYTAADIAYMYNKINRGSTYMVMTLGHDHHSFAQRLHGLHQALGLEQYPLDIILYQLVKMKQNDVQVRMSKRSGSIITLRDVIETVGTDVARFFYLHKKADSQLEFDLALALKKTDENPVFYIQYAYVRAHSLLEKAKELSLANTTSTFVITEHEEPLLKKMLGLYEVLAAIELNHQPHLLATYTIELATLFHSYYNQVRIVQDEHHDRRASRLTIVQEVKKTFKLCFDLLGISAPEKM